MAMLDKGMIRVQCGMGLHGVRFTMLLRTVCNVKLVNQLFLLSIDYFHSELTMVLEIMINKTPDKEGYCVTYRASVVPLGQE